jgi:serine/threonine protein kinase/formylglycine-generating enzyme required for sulfatase activity
VDQSKVSRKDKPPAEIKLPQRKVEPEDKTELEAGAQIAERYEIDSVLGVGPIGTVYRSHDLDIDVDVALKIISPKLLQSREEKKKFVTEIRNVRKINHPNVVRIYDEDQDGDYVFFTMQLLEGLSLRKIIRLRREKNQDFSPKELEPIFSHICQALDRAHEVSAHGNLKPENIIVLPDVLKITDFGLFDALPRKPFVASQKIAPGGLAYLAPELRESEQEIEPSADIYSLGVILCEMLSGEIYAGPSVGLPRLKKENEVWLPLTQRALNENPSKRHRSARDFFEEFRAQVPDAGPLKKVASPPQPAPARESEPPKEAPEGKKISFGLDHSDYPPMVVDTETITNSEDIAESMPTGEIDQAAVEAIREVADDEIINDVFEDIGSEVEEIEEIDESLEDGTTEPVTPELIVDKQFDLRAAKPVASSPPLHTPAAQPATPHPGVPKEVRVTGKKSTPPRKGKTKTEPVVRPTIQAPCPQPAYGPFSQPPFPPGYSQVPMPRISRTPLYVFLAVILAAVSVGTYFLVDYLRAQSELVRAQATATLTVQTEEQPVMATAPTGEMPKTKPTPEPVKTAMVIPSKEDDKKEEETRKVEAEQKKTAPQAAAEHTKAVPIGAPKTEAAMQATLKSSQAVEPQKNHKASRAEKLRKASEEQKRRERKRQAVAKKPKLEEVPEMSQPVLAKPTPPTPPPAPKKKVAIAEKPNGSGACPRGMVYIPAGKSYIGSATNDPMRNFGEIKLHAVDAQAFCIDRYEYPNAPGKKPKALVSWQAAGKACKQRGKRLCSEEEWEYACKGKGNRSFPYGNKWNPDTCNTENANATDRSVQSCGSFPRCRSPFGVFDMSGNVSEWTASKYSSSASARTYKGGSATRPNWATRCASRGNASPGTRKPDLGFRCCANPK